MNNADSEYFRLLNFVLEKGRVKTNRTGIDTIGVFGAQARFNLQEGFPLLTTKKVFFKGIAHELLWFIKGDTNIKYLVDNNVHIWDEWAYARYKKSGMNGSTANEYKCLPTEPNTFVHLSQAEFIERIKNDTSFAKKWGELGEGTYGGMWRAFPYFADEGRHELGQEYTTFGVVDQLKKVLDKLKSNPDDRRLIVSAWHPYWVDHCALPPCHALFQFHTELLTEAERLDLWQKKFAFKDGETTIMVPAYLPNFEGKNFMERFDQDGIPTRRLNCQLYQRSCDLFLGVPFNIASYALLTQMVAQSVGMVAGEFIHSYGDLHIYTNHLEQVKEQLSRKPFENLPRLVLNSSVKNLFDFTYGDIAVAGYESHPAIKGEVAV
jgi:thymidylate synthase